ncbi:uncharacterized protein KRP23_13090 [Phytophthora ramorum]|uniref:uncharacterized protein n=1 Tax=Phytophthora ramorum TaxID=164328 RepID=UPI00309D15E0|nr:hypothetical protein KRP23_13090 [Phytophthora ramorum]
MYIDVLFDSSPSSAAHKAEGVQRSTPAPVEPRRFVRDSREHDGPCISQGFLRHRSVVPGLPCKNKYYCGRA